MVRKYQRRIKGGVKYVAPERRKLNLDPGLISRLESVIKREPVKDPEQIPEAPPLSEENFPQKQPKKSKPLKRELSDDEHKLTLYLVLNIGRQLDNLLRYQIKHQKRRKGGVLGKDEFLSPEELAKRIMDQKTTNQRANLLKGIHDVNTKTYDQAIIGLSHVYPEAADEIIDKAVDKIHGGKRFYY